MKIKGIALRLITQFLAAGITGFVLEEIAWRLCSFLEDKFGIAFVRLPGSFYLTFFLSVPLGCALGIYLVDRITKTAPKFRLWGIVLGLWAGLFGVALPTRIIPHIGYNFDEWLFERLGVRIDELVSLLEAAIFALIGYNCIRLIRLFFDRMHSVRYEKNEETTPKGRCRIITSNTVAFVILCVSIVTIFLGIIYRSELFNKKAETRAFLEQVIVSINKDTDLYKQQFQKLSEIKQNPWQYLDQVSDKYTISLVDFNFDEGRYDYIVTFNGNMMFHVLVRACGGDELYLEEFRPSVPPYRL